MNNDASPCINRQALHRRTDKDNGFYRSVSKFLAANDASLRFHHRHELITGGVPQWMGIMDGKRADVTMLRKFATIDVTPFHDAIHPMAMTKALPWTKLFVLAGVLAIAATGYARFGDSLTLESLSSQESSLRTFGAEHPVLVYAIAFAIYVAVTGLSLPGAAVLTLAFGWYFGLVRGLALVSFASTSGATIAFLLSRYLLRDTIQAKFGDKLTSFNENLQREGAFYLFTLRLIPAVPFFIINLVMGLTPMKTRTFWWVSQVGMLAGTAVFVYAGSTFPTLAALAEQGAGGIISPELLAAFVALGMFPLAAKKGIAIWRKRTQPWNGSAA